VNGEDSGSIPIRGGIELPARREEVELHTSDGLTLVGELALPLHADPVATLVTLHPLPTAGGFMDSHILRKAAARLPALADIAVLRFNFRGVTSPRGTSAGEFGNGVDEGLDLEAAMAFVTERGLPNPWLLGWSFGTDVVLTHGRGYAVGGVILLSPPLRTTTRPQIAGWAATGTKMVALIPEFDDFLRPPAARDAFSVIPDLELIAVDGGKHLWVGEDQTYRVLSEVVAKLNPRVLPLPTVWNA
jgi:uncharacterized protein